MTEPILRAGRLLVLYRLREAGLLDEQRLHVIGEHFGVSRYTISRDFEVLDRVEEEYERLMTERPWPDPTPAQALRDAGYLKIQEMAEVSGYSMSHLGCLVRANKIDARRIGAQWWVHPQAVQAYVEGKTSKRGPARGPHGLQD